MRLRSRMPSLATAAPSPAALPAVTTPPPPSAETFARDAGSAGVLPDALAALMPAPATPENAKPAASVTAPVPAPAAPAAVESPPAAAAPPVEVPAAESDEFKLAKNWRLAAKNEKEALVFQAIREGKDPREAVRLVYGDEPAAAPATAAPAAPVAPAVNPVAEMDTAITGLQTEITELQTQIDKATTDGETATAIKLVQEQGRKERLLERTQDQRQSTLDQHQQHQVDQQVDHYARLQADSARSAIKGYAELVDKDGAGRAAFNLANKELREDPAWKPIFDSPNWPMVVANHIAQRDGWRRQSAPPAPPAASTPAPAPAALPPVNPVNPLAPPAPQPAANRVTAAEVISPAAAASTSAPTATADTFWKDADTKGVTPSDLLDLMAHAPIDPKLMKLAGRRTA